MGQFVRAERHDATAPPTDSPPVPRPVSRHARWLRPGDMASVGGHDIPGGMIYFGRRLRAARGGRTEPALINPALELDHVQPDLDGKDLSYWPSYDTIPPASRTAYLRWLAEGRRTPGVPIGYVFLFFYGLERRLLLDITEDPSLRTEVPALRSEVRGLLASYGSHAAFRRYAAEFSNLLELVDSPTGTDPDALSVPELCERRWPPPMTLRRALGAFAAAGRPVPADWAQAWAWYHPDVSLRTPAFRCRDEFAELFRQRYEEAHGAGLVLHPGTRYLRVEYQPASAGLRRSVYGRQDIPDVFLADASRWHLSALVAGVTDDLGAYSRWLRRHADLRDTVAGAALLPAELVVDARRRSTRPDVAALQTWLDHRLDRAVDGEAAAVEADDLAAWWPTTSTAGLTRRDAAALARLLGHLGVGIEPDVRLGGPAPALGQTVMLFRTGDDGHPGPTDEEWAAAVTLARLGAGVCATAEGHTDLPWKVADPVRSAVPLCEDRLARLRAHLRWATAANAGTIGLRKYVDRLPAERRAAIGDLLVTLATGGGGVLPAQVAGLTLAFYRLGLDPDTVPSRLHTSLTTQARPPLPATSVSRHTKVPARLPALAPILPAQAVATSGPVTVRPGGGPVGDYALPQRPPPAEPSVPAETTSPAETASPAESPRPAEPAGPGAQVERAGPVEGCRPDPPLDRAVIEAKQAETAAVSALLDSIFGDDVPDEGHPDAYRPDAHHPDAHHPDELSAEDAASPADPISPISLVSLVAGLDGPHSALLRALAKRPTWPEGDFDALASRFGLLPASALDVLNDAALDATDEPVATIQDDIAIDPDILQELLG